MDKYQLHLNVNNLQLIGIATRGTKGAGAPQSLVSLHRNIISYIQIEMCPDNVQCPPSTEQLPTPLQLLRYGKVLLALVAKRCIMGIGICPLTVEWFRDVPCLLSIRYHSHMSH